MSKEVKEKKQSPTPYPDVIVNDNFVDEVKKHFQSETAIVVEVLDADKLLTTTNTKTKVGTHEHIVAPAGSLDELATEGKAIPHSIAPKSKKRKKRSLQDVPPDQRVYVEPGEFDVVGGSGGKHEHPGNILFTIKAIELKLDEMASVEASLACTEPARRRFTKELRETSVAKLIASVEPHRFLDKDDDKGRMFGRMFLLPPATIRRKAQQKFRDLGRLSRDELLKEKDDQLDKLPWTEDLEEDIWNVSDANDAEVLELLKEFL